MVVLLAQRVGNAVLRAACYCSRSLCQARQPHPRATLQHALLTVLPVCPGPLCCPSGSPHHHAPPNNQHASTVLEWSKANGGPQTYTPAEDPGVVACRAMYAYFRRHGHATINMPASWRSSTGSDLLDEVRRCAGVAVAVWVPWACRLACLPEQRPCTPTRRATDVPHATWWLLLLLLASQVRALAGTDRMTIPPPLLQLLADDTRPLPRQLTPGPDGTAAECRDDGSPLSEGDFRWQLANDGAANDKLAAGLRAFAGDTAALVKVLRAHPAWA